MCGIVGFVGPADPACLAGMIGTLAHRGPDGRGSWSDGRVHLGHTRLAVIDLATGQQPMESADGRFVIVFNGEIYDHAILREELLARGVPFRTTSDTEVIVEAYRAWGRSALDRLRGMFAFVLYDRQQGRVFGARDRFGKKPLYLTRGGAEAGWPGGRWAFASEATPLTLLGRKRPSIDPDGLVSYLVHDGIVSPRSIWRGMESLPPGHAFEWDLESAAGPQFFRYWDRLDLRQRASGSPDLDPVEPSSAKLISLLERAVTRRLVADVPLGVFLSGGVDSSAVLALAARHRPAREIPTFSIGFDDPSFDESPWAEQVARAIGSDHHHRLFTADEMLASLDGVVGQLDEPLADPSLLPTAMLSRFAREHVTVALSGEGGDELLAGYDPFRALRWAGIYRRLVPRAWTPMVRRLARRMVPASERNMSLDFKVERFLRGLDVPCPMQLPTWMGSFSHEELGRLCPSARDRFTREEVFGDVFAAHEQAGKDPVESALDFFQRFYLPHDILRKVDRASMMVGLELRCPFLDTEFAEYANRLPAPLKLHGGVTKYLLKEGLREAGILPSAVIDRPKKGFGIPVARWLRGELRPALEQHLVADWPASLDLIDPQRVRDLVREHLARRANRAKELWSLLVLSLWTKSQAV